MKLGIVGLPNVGKSTLFNAITQSRAESANYPFCTIEPNVGVVTVPDERLNVLAEMSKSEKIVPTAIEFYDIAGLVKGASHGEGLGNQFLSHIREVAAIVQVVRCFEDPNIIHVDGSINPLRDVETINLELIFSDLEMLERRYQKLKKAAQADKTLANEASAIAKIIPALEVGAAARTVELTEAEEAAIKAYNLLTKKPIIYVANVAEDEIADDGANNVGVAALRKHAENEEAEVVVISAEIESQLAELEDDEKQMFLEDLGVSESGLTKLIKASYSLLGLISFLTTGPTESRAWTIRKGSKAPVAGGKIHSDIQRGFIRAEVIAYDALIECGSMATAKERGLIRSEGKEYEMKDGDVVLFRFNV